MAVAGDKHEGLVDLQHAAELAGVTNAGERASGNNAIETGTAQHWINWAAYEIASAFGARPGEPDIFGQFFRPDGTLKSPDEISNNDLRQSSTAVDNYAFAHGQHGLGSDIPRWYNDAAGK